MEKTDLMSGLTQELRASLKPDSARTFLLTLVFSAVVVWLLTWPIDERLSAFREAGAATLFSRLVEHDGRQLDQLTGLLASDYALREAVATLDTRTIASALRNHQQRVGADFSVMLSTDGRVLGDSSGARTPGEPLRHSDPLAALASAKDAPKLALVSGRLYRISGVQILAPVPYGTLLVGYRIEKRLAQATRSMLHLNTSFVCSTRSGAPRMTERPDVPGAERQLVREFEPLVAGAGRGLGLPGGEQVIATYRLDSGHLDQCVAVLSGDASVGRAPVLASRTLALVLALLGAAGLACLAWVQRRRNGERT